MFIEGSWRRRSALTHFAGLGGSAAFSGLSVPGKFCEDYFRLGKSFSTTASTLGVVDLGLFLPPDLCVPVIRILLAPT